ncbi:MAG: sugar phosphate nucleotidyltransferase [bacterium]
MSKYTNISAVVLAAGKGTRINNGQPAEIPKVLMELNGKPMVEYSVELLESLEILEKILVVGYKRAMIQDYFGDRVKYAVQEEQLGTGHAIGCGLAEVSDKSEYVLALQGDDSAFYQKKTIANFIDCHIKNNALLSFITVEYPETRDIGRVIRDDDGKVLQIVEKESMTEDLWKFTEINAGFYLFNKKWLAASITKLQPSTTGKGELIAPDLIKLALEENRERVIAYKLENLAEWHGVNTPEQLQAAREKKN